jgi:hypothetical protein
MACQSESPKLDCSQTGFLSLTISAKSQISKLLFSIIFFPKIAGSPLSSTGFSWSFQIFPKENSPNFNPVAAQDKDRTVAFITKGWAGGAQEIFTSANSFYVAGMAEVSGDRV